MEGDEIFNKEIKALHEILNEGKVEEVRELRQTKVFSSLLTRYGVELINSISSFLNDKRLYKCPDIVECYEEILKLIVDEIDPQELFVTLLEQVDEENCCLEKFLMLLAPLKFSLLKLGSTRGYWLEWTLSTIRCYLQSVPSPEDHEVEFDEKKMMVSDKYIDSILLLSKKLLEFYHTFLDDNFSEREKNALIAFGFHLLAEPAMYVYLEKFDELRQMCDEIVSGINRLYGKMYYFLEFIDEIKACDLDKSDTSSLMDDSEEPSAHPLWDKISTLPLAVYYSVLITDKFYMKFFPCVFCPMYLFHKLFYLSIVLMRHSHNAVVRKGLLLCQNLLSGIENGRISHDFLEYSVHKHFIKVASHVSIYSYIFENRKLAVELLQTFIHKFDTKGTYLLFLNMTDETANEDIDGEIITIFRKMMHQNFLDNKLEYYQKGKLLIDLLKTFAKLSNGSDTNLMTSKNKIISFLYLLALIFRRDGQNQTTIYDYFDYFENNYFNVIKEAIKKSRENYKRDVSSFMNEDEKSSFEDSFSIVVEGKSLPRLQREDKLNATRNALTVLNMIEHAMELVYEYANRKFRLY